MVSTDQLLARVYQAIEEYEEYKDNNQDAYNIFEVLEISGKEVIMCRMLADLINPEGLHDNGNRFLLSFVDQVLGMHDIRLSEPIYVQKEVNIDSCKSGRNNRRIDIVLQTPDKFIPIEVKIGADDGESQCYDYFHYAKEQMGDEARIYYLTIDGSSPSEKSVSLFEGEKIVDSVPEDRIVNLSFKKEICSWLRYISDADEEGRRKDLILQYLHAVENMSGAIGYEEGLLVEEQILQDSRSFEAALWVEETIEQAKIKLMTAVMDEIKVQMVPMVKKYGLKELGPKSYYSLEERVSDYYKYNESSYPGINYRIDDGILADGKEIWLRVEIDWYLFAGFCLYDPYADAGKGNQVDEMEDWKEEISKYFKDMSVIENEDWWIMWCYLPSGDHTVGKGALLSPEFKSFNKTAVQLADGENRTEMVKRYVKVIENRLLTRIK